MRFATWVQDGQVTTGVASDDGLHAFDRQTTILELVRAGLPVAFEAGAAALGRRPVDLAAVRLLPPLEPPPSATSQLSKSTWMGSLDRCRLRPR
jgi:hypothetical protein